MVIIIGVLAAIAIPVSLNQRQKGYHAQGKSDLISVDSKISPADSIFAAVANAGTSVQGLRECRLRLLTANQPWGFRVRSRRAES